MNTDFELINNIKASISEFDTYVHDILVDGLEYPLDNEVRHVLFEQITSDGQADEFEIYKRIDVVKHLWAVLITILR